MGKIIDTITAIDKQALLLIALLFIAITVLSMLIIRFKNKILYGSILLLIIGVLGFIYPLYFFSDLLPYLIGPSMAIGLLIGLLSMEESVDPIWDVKFLSNKGTRIIKNIKRGVLIMASSGGGKTESPIYALLKHLSLHHFSGIIYDYKDGELTEMCMPLFGDRLKKISMHYAFEDSRINVFSTKYIKDEKDINEIVMVLLKNLGDDEKSEFFIKTAGAALSAIILKFHLDHKEYCTLPHIISFLLAADFSEYTGEKDHLGREAIDQFGKLKRFLSTNKRVAIQASSFTFGLVSARQTGAVLATLANYLRQLSFPEAFWNLSADTIDLDLNSDENQSVLCVINEPKNDTFLTPILATLVHITTKQMMVRNRKPSFVLLDEAPTIKLLNMAKIPATMRSFGVAVIYAAQDKAQGIVSYGRDKFREITSNLSTQIFGKSNDPETSKFYESYFELIEKDQKSISKKGSGSFFDSTSSTTVSKKESSKVRAFEFFGLKQGEFAFMSNGKNEILRFNKMKIEREEIDFSKRISNELLLHNYNKIIKDMQLFVSRNIK